MTAEQLLNYICVQQMCKQAETLVAKIEVHFFSALLTVFFSSSLIPRGDLTVGKNWKYTVICSKYSIAMAPGAESAWTA